MTHIKKHIYIYFLLLITLIAGLIAGNNLKKTDGFGTPFVSDVDQYYSILPAAFLVQDVAYQFDTAAYWSQYYPEGTFYQRYWTTEYLPSKSMTMATFGLPYAYAFFFVPAMVVDNMFSTNNAAPGYSKTYIVAARIFNFLLAFFACLFMFKIAARYTNEKYALISSSLLFYGTGTLYYFFGEGLMPHAVLTVLISFFIYGCLRLLHDGKVGYFPLLVFLVVWIGLIRPTDVLICLFPICLLVKQNARSNLLVALKSIKHIILAICLSGLLIIPQLLYWKYITGSYILYSYKEETFHFAASHLLDFWFSFRKGWFIYTPLTLLVLLAALTRIKKLNLEVGATYLVIIVSSLLYAQWWCWWYGGSFGMRTMTQFVPFLIFPLVIFISKSSQASKALFFLVAAFFTFNTIKLARKYHLGYVHYDSETYQSLKGMYFGKHKPYDYNGLLEKPDYKGARRNGVEFEFKQVLEVNSVTKSERYIGDLNQAINHKQGYVVAKVYHPKAYENVTLVLKILNDKGEEVFHQQKFLSESSFNDKGQGFNMLDFSFEKTDLINCKAVAFIHNPELKSITIKKLELILY